VIDHGAQDVTTTEGEAYAMFFALVANDPARFERLVNWTEANLAQGDLSLHLPAWSWGKAPDGSWRVLDPNPASDADLWMAYALSEGGRLWGLERYTKLGSTIASRVAQSEVVLIPRVGTTLLPGAQGFHPTADTYYLNPSYLPPMLLAYFAHNDPQAPWRQVAGSLPVLLQSSGGYAMDWMRGAPEGLQPAAPPAAEQQAAMGKRPPAVAVGSYDAIRVYLWLGISDPKTPEVRAYLQTHLSPPEQVDANGKILSQDAPPGFSAAVVPYLHALGLKQQEAAEMNRLTATFDSHSGLYGHNGDYYDQNLALFAMGWVEHRYSFGANGTLLVKWK
jgi:endo-1,4-beta-D-glucanase Y